MSFLRLNVMIMCTHKYGEKRIASISRTLSALVPVTSHHMFRWLSKAILALASCLTAFGDGQTRGFEVEGVISRHCFKATGEPLGTVLSFDFRMAVSNQCWIVRTVERRLGADYAETGSEGGRIYYYRSYTNALEQHRKSGKPMPINEGSGVVHPGPVPHTFTQEVNSILWFAYGSGPYLRQAETKVEPLFFYERIGLDFEELHYLGITYPAQVGWPNANAPCPARVILMHDGKIRGWPIPQGSWVSKPDVSQLTAPYHEGFTNVVYSVSEWNETHGQSIPIRFSYSVYNPKSDGKAKADLYLLQRFEGHATNIIGNCNTASFLPLVHGLTEVTDFRFFRPDSADVRVDYEFRQRWLTDSEVRNHPEYKQKVRRMEMMRPALTADIRKAQKNPARSRAITYAAFAALLLCAGIGYRRWIRVHEH